MKIDGGFYAVKNVFHSIRELIFELKYKVLFKEIEVKHTTIAFIVGHILVCCKLGLKNML